MSTAERPRSTTLPPLVEGQRLDRKTFHERYEAMPPGTWAELIGGIVSMASPMSRHHCQGEKPAFVWLDHYEEFTPGVEMLANASTFLDDEGEPQPDLQLRILPECGGQSWNDGDYVGGAPELIVEVSRTTRAKDLGPKLLDYQRTGVREYVVRSIDPDEVIWHVLRDGRLEVVPPDADGLYRSRVFPGLWLDPAALLRGDRPALRATLDLGLAAPEHAAFVARLAAAREANPA